MNVNNLRISITPIVDQPNQETTHHERSSTELTVDNLIKGIKCLTPIDLKTVNDDIGRMDEALRSMHDQHEFACVSLRNLTSTTIEKASASYDQGFQAADKALSLAREVLERGKKTNLFVIRHRRDSVNQILMDAKTLLQHAESNSHSVGYLAYMQQSLTVQRDKLTSFLDAPQKLSEFISDFIKIRSDLESTYFKRPDIKMMIVDPLILESNKLTQLMNEISEKIEALSRDNMTTDQDNFLSQKLSEALNIYDHLFAEHKRLQNYPMFQTEFKTKHLDPLAKSLIELKIRCHDFQCLNW